MFAFADDTKCFMKIVSELDIQKFQDLSSVSIWGNNNNLAFGIPRCDRILENQPSWNV